LLRQLLPHADHDRLASFPHFVIVFMGATPTAVFVSGEMDFCQRILSTRFWLPYLELGFGGAFTA
jgi:hypothetical protein